MKSYWNWSLCIIWHQCSTASVQMFRILQQEGRVFSNSLPLLFKLLFFLLCRMVLRRQWCNSIFICFLLFGFHCKGSLAFMCLICHSSDAVLAFKALGAVWTKPSVWVGRFIKWQTGSHYLANVSHGRWQQLVCLCVWWRDKTGRKREVERFHDLLWKHFNIPHKRLHHRGSCNCTTERFMPLWIYNDNWMMEPFSFHLIPWNTG